MDEIRFFGLLNILIICSQSLTTKRVMSKHELDNMNTQIILLRRSVYQLSTTCNNKRNEIVYLQNQIQVVEGYIDRLKSDNQQKIGNETHI